MRLLLIASTDYGEMGSALYFLRGLPPEPRPVLAIPAALRTSADSSAGADIRTYDGLADILRMIERCDPQIVLLFSGYLLTIGARNSLANDLRLLDFLRRRRIAIATTDPFLGLLRNPGKLRFTQILRATDPGRGAAWVWLRSHLLALRLYVLHLALRSKWHIYPAPVDSRHFRLGQRRLCFGSDAEPPLAAHRQINSPSTWLFVLSRIDHRLQMLLHGTTFVAQLASRLQDCVSAGRRAVLICPASLVATLRENFGGSTQVELLSGVSYSDYMTKLMCAEYAFFWNLFSFSVLHRMLAVRPVFFFDEGHAVTLLPALKRAGVDSYYGGWTPPLLRADARLELSELQQYEADIRVNFARVARAMRECMTPAEVLRTVARAR